MDQVIEKWNEILNTVKTEHEISDVSFDTWMRPLEVFGIVGNKLYILVPSEQMALSYISKKYYLPLKVAVAEITGIEYEIEFILPEQAKKLHTAKAPKAQPANLSSDHSNLNPNYTFETFVVGNNNPICCSCSCRITRRSIQPSLYIWRPWTWKNASDAFHWTFYSGAESRYQGNLCNFRGIYK